MKTPNSRTSPGRPQDLLTSTDRKTTLNCKCYSYAKPIGFIVLTDLLLMKQTTSPVLLKVVPHQNNHPVSPTLRRTKDTEQKSLRRTNSDCKLVSLRGNPWRNKWKREKRKSRICCSFQGTTFPITLSYRECLSPMGPRPHRPCSIHLMDNNKRLYPP